MNLSESLRTALLADAAIVALVVDRIHPVAVPVQASAPPTLPLIVYTVRKVFDRNISGYAGKALITIHCWGRDYDESHSVADAVFAELEGLRNVILGGGSGVMCRHVVAVEQDEEWVEISPDAGAFDQIQVYDILYQV